MNFSTCDHRLCVVVIIFLVSVLGGVLAGVILFLLGLSKAAAVVLGGAVVAGIFGIMMSAANYIARREE